MISFKRWQNIPLIAQMLLVASGVLLLVGVVLTLTVVNEERGRIAREAQTALKEDLDTLPTILQEPLVIGDFASIEQLINNYVLRRDVRRIVFRDVSGSTITAEDRSILLTAPSWFANQLGLEEPHNSRVIVIGKRDYGTLILTGSIVPAINQAWDKLSHQLQIIAFTLLFNLAAFWLLLRIVLRPLKQLDQASQALTKGQLATRIEPLGSPEFQHVARTFNSMAAALQDNINEVARSRSELQRFAEIAAHHLQEPARRLSSYSQRLKSALADLPKDSEASLSLGFIDQQARRLQNLLRDIQLYLAAGQPRGQMALTAPGPLLERLRERLQGRLNQAGATLGFGDLPPAWLDAPRFTDIFSSLVDNALCHGGRRPLHISISATQQEGYVLYCVADTGHGIPPEYRERIFRVFERLGSDHEGTGIGLAVVRQIALSAGGNAWIGEAAGGGCAVYFKLPQGEPLQ